MGEEGTGRSWWHRTETEKMIDALILLEPIFFHFVETGLGCLCLRGITSDFIMALALRTPPGPCAHRHEPPRHEPRPGPAPLLQPGPSPARSTAAGGTECGGRR